MPPESSSPALADDIFDRIRQDIDRKAEMDQLRLDNDYNRRVDRIFDGINAQIQADSMRWQMQQQQERLRDLEDEQRRLQEQQERLRRACLDLGGC